MRDFDLILKITAAERDKRLSKFTKVKTISGYDYNSGTRIDTLKQSRGSETQYNNMQLYNMVSRLKMADHIFIYSDLDLRHGVQVVK